MLGNIVENNVYLKLKDVLMETTSCFHLVSLPFQLNLFIIFLVFANKKITEKKEEFFSLLVFKDINSRHSGKYTCFATNAAAKVNYTADLQVRGKFYSL